MVFLENQKPKNKFKIPISDNAMIAVIMLFYYFIWTIELIAEPLVH